MPSASPKWKVELAVESDAEEISFLHQRIFNDGWTPESFHSFLTDEHSFVYTARCGNDQLAGFLVLRIVCDDAEIITIGASPDFRRQGVGGQLCETAITASRTGGAGNLFLEVREDNSPAVALYERSGFQITGTRKGYYKSESSQNRINAYVMQVPL